MTGRQFEEFLASLFASLGYTEIRMTPATDQGGDLICLSPRGIKTVIQAKRWNGSIGNKAVQEVLGAMRHYGCEEGIVVTNSTFTPAAKQLVAGGTDVTLLDRNWLQDKMDRFLPVSIPEFNRLEFEQIIEGWIQLTRDAASNSTRRRTRLPRGGCTLSEALMYAGQAKGKELTFQEVKKLAQLHGNLSDAEAQYRDSNNRLQEAQERMRQMEQEQAELEEALSESEPAWVEEELIRLRKEDDS
ncbi:MAG TPA: restriction endonuclease [Pyrinomonadaceae bacterium]|nr:restriction endonuclease [Pyrinomonadaceae bacterium]